MANRLGQWALRKPLSGSQIRWGNLLTRDLVHVSLFNQGASRTVSDVVGGVRGTLSSGSKWIKSSGGYGIDFDSSNVNFGDSDIFVGATEFTFFTRMKLDSVPGSGGVNVIRKDGTTNALQLDAFFGGSPGWQTALWGSSLVIYKYTYTPPTGVWLNTVVRWSLNRNSGAPEVWENGIFLGLMTIRQGVAPTVPLVNANNPLVFGANDDATGEYWDGKLSTVFVWTRWLADQEIRSLQQDHFQIISSPSRRSYKNVSAVVPTTGIMTPRSGYWGDL